MTPATAVTVAAAVGSGLVGGVFAAFSGIVVPALDRLPAAQATAAMQQMNVTALRPPLMVALFGTAALALAAPLLARGHAPPATTGLLWAAGATYLVGAVGVTGLGNVPLNEALAAGAVTGAREWAGWSRSWTGLNHVRTVAALGSAALYALALTRS